MKITHTDIYKFSIPMHPFTIAIGTMDYAQNIFIRIQTDEGVYGVGECSAFPVITGETQATCYEMAKDFAVVWKEKCPLEIEDRMEELNAYVAGNHTIKSAFDMALYDISAKKAGLPLYAFLGGGKKSMETDLTIGIGNIAEMVRKAVEFVAQGVKILKIKLGQQPQTDIQRIKEIRQAVGNELPIRIDANQGWTYEEALEVLTALKDDNIEFCEQPMRRYNDHLLPELSRRSPVPIMADESVFDHHDALRLIRSKSCRYVNIKFAKSGGIREALRINEICQTNQIPCMIGGMLESRIALTAFAHFAAATPNIKFYDMDTCMLGHLADPVKGGISFHSFIAELPDENGIGADADEDFLRRCEYVSV